MAEARTIEKQCVVVGAGPQALTLVTRWVEERGAAVADLAVVDPAGRWLAAWDRAFEQQRIPVLRSPGVHHPASDEMSFIWNHQHNRAALDTVCRRKVDAMTGPLRRPSRVAFRGFCNDVIGRFGLQGRVLQGEVAALDRTTDSWRVDLGEGRCLLAERVFFAGNPRVACVPSGVELGGAIEHAESVDLDELSEGETVAVIGGGQSAGQMALEARRSGASVMLFTRGPCRVADLDVDAGWLMRDHIEPFRAIVDPVERRRVVDQARRGSMTAELVDALDSVGVCRLHDLGHVDVTTGAEAAMVSFAGAQLRFDRVILATGWIPDARADHALRRLVAEGAPHVDGLPVLDAELAWLDDLYVVGALAALTLGPAAGNLGGARAAADLLARHGPSCDHVLSRIEPSSGPYP